MTDPVRLHTVRDECRDEAVETLRQLLRAAESGEILAVSGIAELPGGSYRQFGSATMSRLQTAGALLELAVSRLDQ